MEYIYYYVIGFAAPVLLASCYATYYKYKIMEDFNKKECMVCNTDTV